jgi:ABC-type branched-subunit amino acid transport system ATPase component
MPDATVPLLEVRDVSKRFGGVRALHQVSLELEAGQVVGLIGPNGSGKTTLMNVLSGVYPPDGGTVTLEGQSVAGLRPYTLVTRGMARTFQSARVFQTITVEHNMMVPVLHDRSDPAVLAERSATLLQLVGLEHQAHQAASELSGGQQRLLEFARALMTQPRVVLMDEPFAGVHPEIKQSLLSSLREMQDQGISFLLVSHELPVITRIASELVCLASGEVIARGTATDVTGSPRVEEAYLGHRRRRVT